jgi:hypothetical protein
MSDSFGEKNACCPYRGHPTRGGAYNIEATWPPG